MIGREALPSGTLHDWLASLPTRDLPAPLFGSEEQMLRLELRNGRPGDATLDERSHVRASLAARAAAAGDATPSALATEIWSTRALRDWLSVCERQLRPYRLESSSADALATPLVESSAAPQPTDLWEAAQQFERVLASHLPGRARFVDVELREFCYSIRRADGGLTAWRGRRIAVELTLGPNTASEHRAGFSRRYELSDLTQLDACLAESARFAETCARLSGAREREVSLESFVLRAPLASFYLGRLARLLDGRNVARRRSCLTPHDLGAELLRSRVEIYDDPAEALGVGGRPFDDLGRPIGRLQLIRDGSLAGFLLDSESARLLGLTDERRGWPSAGGASEVRATNFVLAAGSAPGGLLIPASELELVTLENGMFDERRGLFDDRLSGFASIAGRRVAVREIRLSGSLLELFGSVAAVGRDRERFRGTSSPSLWIRRPKEPKIEQ